MTGISKNSLINKILEKKVIAIVRGYNTDDCINIAKALFEGGIELMEVTFPQTTEDGVQKTAKTIKALKDSLGSKMEFGAGTVTSVELVRIAHDSGATFIISPDTNKEVIRETVKLNMVSIPGALTPTEIKSAYDCGADFVKVFPSNVFGPSYFKAVLAPLSQVKLLAVGGVTDKDIADYLRAGVVGTGVSGCLVKKDWVQSKDWTQITEASKKFISAVESVTK